MVVIGFGKGKWDGYGNAHNPDGRKEQAELHACEFGVDALDDDCAVVLRADPDADYAEIHECQWPEAPV